MVRIPHTTAGIWPEGIPAGRFAAHVHQALPAGCRVAMIGLADDLGVRLNGGRPGARDGPRAFRAALARYGVAHPQGWQWPLVLDAGDVTPAPGHDESALHETHRRTTEAVAALLDMSLLPIAIGGGHDLTFPFVRAAASRAKLSGVYFDAHLDVRDTPGSGMPFRKLIEDCGIARLDQFGMDRFANAQEHVEWLLTHGGAIHGWNAAPRQWRDGLPPGGDLFVSVDLDVLDASQAPGVSAMNPSGWSAATLEPWVTAAGSSPRVRCFDIMELCPEHDPDGRTARLAARLFLAFLRGFAERSP